MMNEMIVGGIIFTGIVAFLMLLAVIEWVIAMMDRWRQ